MKDLKETESEAPKEVKLEHLDMDESWYSNEVMLDFLLTLSKEKLAQRFVNCIRYEKECTFEIKSLKKDISLQDEKYKI